MTPSPCPSRRTVRRRRAMAAKKKPVRKTPGNPPESKWYATKYADRNRKPVKVYMEDATRAAMEKAAAKQGLTFSRYVEELILADTTRTK
jgi:hypothetical protein